MDKVWLAWEDHRRSRELSLEFGVPYNPILMDASRYIRYPVLAARTLMFIVANRPRVIFCQNPSIVLAFLLCLFKGFFSYRLVVDRHSNFKFETQGSKAIKWRIFHFLSRYTVKHSDFTIVTNGYLKELCESWGGNAYILQDKIPEVGFQANRNPPGFMRENGFPHVMFVTMFDDDEPIFEIFEACNTLKNNNFYLTGKYSKMISEDYKLKLENDNIFCTGFVSEEDYLSLMQYADVVVVLTTKDYILNCGAYEAYAFGKPVVLSNTETLVDYFRSGAVFVTPTTSGIVDGIRQALENRDSLIVDVCKYREVMKSNWYVRAKALNEAVNI